MEFTPPSHLAAIQPVMIWNRGLEYIIVSYVYHLNKYLCEISSWGCDTHSVGKQLNYNVIAMRL